jgi:hypothetical protein
LGAPAGRQHLAWRQTKREEQKMKKYCAEFIGTLWLVLGGFRSAVLAATFPELGIGSFRPGGKTSWS